MANPVNPSFQKFLTRSGEMGKRIVRHDWAATPLGPLETWPPSLRTAVSLCLSAQFPAMVAWTPQLIQIYNDAYRPLLGPARNTHALGQPARECWAEYQDFIETIYDHAFSSGQPTQFKRQPRVLDRQGFGEEAYFTFSAVPIWDEQSRVSGIFQIAFETTDEVLADRRMRALRELNAVSSNVQSVEEACELASAIVAGHAPDLPFALIYLMDAERRAAHLTGSAGIPRGTPQSPLKLLCVPGLSAVSEATVAYGEQIKAVLDSKQPVRVGDPGAPEMAPVWVFPVTLPGQADVSGFLIAGTSPRLPWNDAYRGFLELVATHIGTAVANARDRIAAEKRVHESEERLRHAAKVSGQTELALREALRARDEFLSIASHELRTPLTTLKLQTQIAKRQFARDEKGGMEPARVRHLVEIEDKQVNRLSHLVEDMLDISRIAAGKLKLHPEAFELTQLVRDTVEHLSGFLSNSRCPVWIESLRPVHVYWDRFRMEQVFSNLLTNAAKYGSGHPIEIRISEVDQVVEVTVRDHGRGIAKVDHERIFHRFERAISASEISGLGLGLYITRSIMEMHQGTVRVESTLGQGATFVTTAPTQVSAQLAPTG